MRGLKIPASSFSPAREGGKRGLSFFLCFLVLCFVLRCVVFCCVVPFFRVFLGKCGKGRFPVSQNFHPAQCPNPNPCVPKPKPIPMHSPQSDRSRHPGKHSPQSDGSRHCLGGMVIKNRECSCCIRYVFAMFLACAPRNPACVSLFPVCSSFSPHECSK